MSWYLADAKIDRAHKNYFEPKRNESPICNNIYTQV